MIVANIGAGMGNQMFMYAAGLSVASRLKTELRLRVPRSPREKRPYVLGCFPGITERIASFNDLWRINPRLALASMISYKPIRKYSVLRYLLCRMLLPRKGVFRNIYTQQEEGYYEKFSDIPDGVCLIGYWESEKFFSGISELVRRKFTFSPECYRQDYLRRIKSCNSVAVHVRRGDKAGKAGRDFYCSQPMWIKAAAEKMSSLTEKPSFFVFSDDIEWCRENMPKVFDTEYTYIEGNTPAQDMALMTECNHVIAGPSTFSWWGAWLNSNPGKIIIAPGFRLYYKNREISHDHLPDEWIKID